MKKLKTIILLIIILAASSVNAAGNPYKPNSSFGVNCTWYAWNQVHDKLGISLPGWGNANEWYKDAQASGYAVGSTPKANSIVVWDNFKSYGHVAFVDHVEGNTIFYWDSQECYREMTEEEHAKYWDCIINETTSEEDSYKCDHLNVKERIPCQKSGKVGDDNLIGYIYVAEKKTTPAPKPTSNANETTKAPTTGTTVITKSSNNNLKSLKVEGIEFVFDTNETKYNLNVSDDVSEIRVTAEAEVETAKVEVNESYKLEYGDNSITIKVTAENGLEKEYILNIKRAEKTTKIKYKKAKVKKNHYNIIAIAGISIFVLAILMILLKKLKK